MRAPGKLQSMPLSERVGLGGIDQTVQDRADTTRITGKPPASTVSNDLLNLMATQKVATEKDAALKQLQAAQQQNPETIKEQLEAKAMGMTLGELTQNTGKALDTRRQQQGKPPMPMQGGIASATQPRPQPAQRSQMPQPPMGGLPSAAPAGMVPKMASGGIVGFNTGGSTNPRAARAQQMQAQRTAAKNTPQAIKAEIQRLQELAKNSRSGAAKMSAQKQIESLQKQLSTMQPSSTMPAGAGVLRQGQTLPPQGGATPPPPAGGIMAAAGVPQNPFVQSAQAATAKPTATGPMPGLGGAPVTPPAPTPTGGIGSVSEAVSEKADPNKIREAGQMGDPNAISGSALGQKVTGQLDKNLAASADPLQAGKDRFAQSSENLGIAELKGMQTAAQADIAAAQKRYDDPAAQAARDVRNYRIGGYKGMLQGQTAREQQELKRLRQKKADMDANNDRIFQRAKAADDNAGKMIKDMMDFNNATTTAMTNIAVYDDTAMRELAKVKASIEKDAQTVILQELGIKTKADLELAIQNMASAAQVLAEYRKYVDAREKYKAQVMTAFTPDYQTLLSKIKGGKATEDEVKAFTQLEDSVNAVLGSETYDYQRMFEAAMMNAGGFKYGTLNPFGSADGGGVASIDKDISDPFSNISANAKGVAAKYVQPSK